MPTFQEAFDWLVALPAVALYAAAFGAAIVENIFPPFPSDLIIAVAAFVASQGPALIGVAYVAVVVGNVLGAAGTYAVGRRYGAAGLRKRLESKGLINREQKIEAMYGRYGLVGLFFGRMIPGVRGFVPMVAGASEIAPLPAMSVVAAAAMIWYGVLMGLAYRVGSSWEEYAEYVGAVGRIGGVGGAIVLVVLAIIGTIVWRRRRRRE